MSTQCLKSAALILLTTWQRQAMRLFSFLKAFWISFRARVSMAFSRWSLWILSVTFSGPDFSMTKAARGQILSIKAKKLQPAISHLISCQECTVWMLSSSTYLKFSKRQTIIWNNLSRIPNFWPRSVTDSTALKFLHNLSSNFKVFSAACSAPLKGFQVSERKRWESHSAVIDSKAPLEGLSGWVEASGERIAQPSLRPSPWTSPARGEAFGLAFALGLVRAMWTHCCKSASLILLTTVRRRARRLFSLFKAFWASFLATVSWVFSRFSLWILSVTFSGSDCMTKAARRQTQNYYSAQSQDTAGSDIAFDLLWRIVSGYCLHLAAGLWKQSSALQTVNRARVSRAFSRLSLWILSVTFSALDCSMTKVVTQKVRNSSGCYSGIRNSQQNVYNYKCKTSNHSPKHFFQLSWTGRLVRF